MRWQRGGGLLAALASFAAVGCVGFVLVRAGEQARATTLGLLAARAALGALAALAIAGAVHHFFRTQSFVRTLCGAALALQALLFVAQGYALKHDGADALLSSTPRPRAQATLTDLLERVDRGDASARRELVERGAQQGASLAQLRRWCGHNSSWPSCRAIAHPCPEAQASDAPLLLRLCGQSLLERGLIRAGEQLLERAALLGDAWARAALQAGREQRNEATFRAEAYEVANLASPDLFGLRVWGSPSTLQIVPASSPSGLAIWLAGAQQPRMRTRTLPAAWQAVRVWLRLGEAGGAILLRDDTRVVRTYDCAALPKACCLGEGDWATVPLGGAAHQLEFVGPLLFGGMLPAHQDG